MRQRVKVAQGIVHDPSVVMLDEPLTGLDPRQRADMIALFQRLGAEGRCVLVSSHVLGEVERIGSRILVMSQGRLAAAGDFRELRALMDDRPMRVRVRTNRPRELAGALLESGAAVGARLDGDDVLDLDTNDAKALARALAPLARDRGASLLEVVPLDAQTSRASFATWCSGEHGRGGCDAHEPARAAVTLAALYRLLLRTQVNVPRLLGIALTLERCRSCSASSLGSTTIPSGPRRTWRRCTGLGIVVPLASLWLGTSVIGDLVEDRLLVYVHGSSRCLAGCCRPRRSSRRSRSSSPSQPCRWPSPLSSREPAPCSRIGLAAALAVAAYSGLFVAAGLWFRRAVWWGLSFILLWESAGARVSDGTARFTVTSWARSIVSSEPGVDVPLDGRSLGAALVVLPAIAVAGWMAATVRYRRADVD